MDKVLNISPASDVSVKPTVQQIIPVIKQIRKKNRK